MPLSRFSEDRTAQTEIDRVLLRLEAVCGLPWLSACATSIIELDALQDALLAKAKVSALHCGYIRDLDGTSGGAYCILKATDPCLSRDVVRFTPQNGFRQHIEHLCLAPEADTLC